MGEKNLITLDSCSANISGVEATHFKSLHHFVLSVNLFSGKFSIITMVILTS